MSEVKFVSWGDVQGFLQNNPEFGINNSENQTALDTIITAISNYTKTLQIARDSYTKGGFTRYRWVRQSQNNERLKSLRKQQDAIMKGFQLLDLLRGFFTDQEIVYAINTPKGLKYATTQDVFENGRLNISKGARRMSQYVLHFSHALSNLRNTLDNLDNEEYITKYRDMLLQKVLRSAAPVDGWSLTTKQPTEDHPAYGKNGPDTDIKVYFMDKKRVAQIHPVVSDQAYDLGWMQEWFLAKYEALVANGASETDFQSLSSQMSSSTPITVFFKYQMADNLFKFSKDNNPGAMMGDLQSHLKNIAIQSKGDNDRIYSFNAVLEGLYAIQQILDQYKHNNMSQEQAIEAFKKLFTEAEPTINQDYSEILQKELGLGKTIEKNVVSILTL